jgi:dienelactone hydrolase
MKYELRSTGSTVGVQSMESPGQFIVTGWSAGGHLTAFILDHPKVTAGLSISGVFDLAALRDSPHVNDKVRLTEVEIETLSPMRRPHRRARVAPFPQARLANLRGDSWSVQQNNHS